MNTSRCLLAAASVLALTAVWTTPTVRAQTVSPVPAPTIITTAPYTISAPGYYQLGANLSYAGNGSANDAIITINSGNVILDFAGHFITGPSNNAATYLNGVYADERGNITIRNGTIAYCGYGIVLNGNGSNTSLNINQQIDNMLVSYCYQVGVDLGYARNSQVTNSRVSFTGGSTATNNAYGIYFFGGSGNRAANNTIVNTTATGSGTATALFGNGNINALDNEITLVTTPSGTTATGITGAIFATGNKVVNAKLGISGGVLQNNLTKGCTTGFGGGYNDGGSNASF